MAQSAYADSPWLGDSQHSQGQQVVPFQTTKRSLKILLLHGDLDIWVMEARNLPNMAMLLEFTMDIVGRLFTKASRKIERYVPHNLSKISRKGSDRFMSQEITSDPYVKISIAGAAIGRTFVMSNTENPIWRQHFNVPVAHYAEELSFVVKHNDLAGSKLIGAVGIPVEQLLLGTKVEGTFPVISDSGEPCNSGAALTVSIQYTPMEGETFYHRGVGSGPDYHGVSGTYFPLRKGGKVTLYQDAHVIDDCLPSLKLEDDAQYMHGHCWQDIFDAINQARHLIYITGWSVHHKVRLVRESNDATNCILGDLLKTKAQEGVRVLLLVWDDPTSHSILGYKKGGIMHTHDEETRSFFKHSSVQVLLCSRSAQTGHSWARKQGAALFSHHQKTVIVDVDKGHCKRKIIAFVGGLDLGMGRYDTPEHPIFRTLQTVHKDDYRNSTFTEPTVGCPRQPWHDLHCRIDGPAAYDILINFKERWLKASKRHWFQKSYVDSLLDIERIPAIVGMADSPCLSEDDSEAWHVQAFRSIDSNSVKGFPEDPKVATNWNLVCGKNVLIDMGIQRAYVKAIRAAQHFIYIENQFFLGSSYNWTSHKDLGANNLVPMEIALKIASKIRQNRRFSAYIVIPMWPQGDPTNMRAQAILFFQHKTMQMMYKTIYKALEEVGLEKKFEPQDYLNFFCLGNRVSSDGNDNFLAGNPAPPNTPQAFAQKSRRFTIHVHSKGMIVDDEYVILGSANINQRSMGGSGDSEIAIGAHQPHYTWANKHSSPHGQIYGYRMSLWAEHIGAFEEYFKKPGSLECVRQVRLLSEHNWRQYAADEVTEMKGHLLKYPLQVDQAGNVNPLPGCETFPDVGGKITGSIPIGYKCNKIFHNLVY